MDKLKRCCKKYLFQSFLTCPYLFEPQAKTYSKLKCKNVS